MELFPPHKSTLQKPTRPTVDWWQMNYLIAIFLFRFLPFGDLFYSTLSTLLTAPSQHCCVAKGLRDILLNFRFSSCFRKHFAKFFKGYHYLIIGYFTLPLIQSLFALTILTDIFCNLLILPFKVVFISKPFVM